MRWSGQGLLPNFTRLLDRGVHGNYDGEFGLTAAEWGSFYTGLSAAGHGLISYDQILPGTYRSAQIADIKIHGETFWETLSSAGQRVLVIDSPHVEPSQINGIHIVDWATHDVGQYRPCRSWPTEIARSVMEQYPPDPLNIDDWGNSAYAKFPRHLEGVKANLERKVALIRQMLNREHWDTAFVTFDECHQLGHLAWALHDSGHPQHDPDQRERLGDPLESAYVALDRALGAVVDDVPDETFILLVAIDGIGPNYGWSHLLDNLLTRIESGNAVGARSERSDGVYQRLRLLWDRAPHRLQKPLQRLKNQMRDRALATRRRTRRAFAIPINENFGGVRINLAGREPNGLVREGREYDAYCDLLAAELRAIVDTETGTPLTRRVTKTREHFRGAFVDHLPDLLVEWETSQPIHRAGSARLGTLMRSFQNIRTGQHQSGGLFVAAWGESRPTSLDEPISINDFAPTLVLRAGVTKHPQYDGMPIAALSG